MKVCLIYKTNTIKPKSLLNSQSIEESYRLLIITLRQKEAETQTRLRGSASDIFHSREMHLVKMYQFFTKINFDILVAKRLWAAVVTSANIHAKIKIFKYSNTLSSVIIL